MGWKGTLRAIESAAKRAAKEAERENKRQQKLQELEDAAYEVSAFDEYLSNITSIHKEYSKSIQWQGLASSKPPPQPEQNDAEEVAVCNKWKNFKPNLFLKLFGAGKKRKQRLFEEIEKAKQKDEIRNQQALSVFKEKYEKWKETKELAERILQKNPHAYLDAVKTLNPFKEIENLGTDIQLSVDDDGELSLDVNVHGSEIIPDIKKTLRQSGALSVKKMPLGEFNEFYQDYVCSVVLRASKEIFALLPIEKTLINAVDELLNPQTGHMEIQPVLSVLIPRETILKLNLDNIDPSDSMRNFVHNMKFKKTKGFEVVERVQLEDFKKID